MKRAALFALPLLVGCGNGSGPRLAAEPPEPPEIEDILWAPVSMAGALDLGHQARELPMEERREAGELLLVDVGGDLLADSQAGGNAHGVGVGFVDVDGDGFEDIVVANGEGTDSALFINQGDGTFADRSQESGIGVILAGVDTYSVAAADYDADGDFDLSITAHPRDYLLQNDGTGVFTDVTIAAGAGGPESSQPGSSSKIGAWGDFDGDGWMDLVVASSTFSNQPSNGYLLRNLGDGSFSDVTAVTAFAAAPTGNPCAVMWSDFDSDGDQDLWIWNDRGNASENRVLLRNDDGVFTNIRAEAGIDSNVGNPMGIDGADVDHDGDLDYYVSDIGGNAFLRNNGDGTFTDIKDVAGARGEYGWGLGFEDFNADGWADIFVAQEDDRDYLTFTNRGEYPLSFVEQRWAHAEIGNGHNVAAAFADFDHNGTIDVVTAGTSGGRLTLYRNDTDLGSNHWLEVRIPEVLGTGANGGIGARIVVKTGELLQFRDISRGASRASQSAMSVRFGLGAWTGAEWVVAMWPDGRHLVVTGVPGNQVLRLSAP